MSVNSVCPAEWQVERVDLPAYLARIGVPGAPGDLTADERTLRRLHRAHVLAIPFENIDVTLGRAVRLDLEAVQAKLVHAGRGGYCYEHAVLLGAALERIGFPVRRVAGRIRMGSASVRPRAHVALLVGEPGRGWLVDVGLGAAGPLSPVPWRDGGQSVEGRWSFRLDRTGESEWVLRTARPDGWFDLYSLDATPQHFVDLLVGHHFASTHPASPFVRRLAAGTSRPDRRLRLADRACTVEDSPGRQHTRQLDDDEFRRVLAEEIGIALSDDDLLLLTAVTRRGSTGRARHGETEGDLPPNERKGGRGEVHEHTQSDGTLDTRNIHAEDTC